MVADEDPAAARQALATIETTSRSALLEMRRMMGVLRESATGQQGIEAPAPGLEDLGELVSDVRQSGVIVDLRIEGERSNVPAGVDLSAYRIVQEALTNVIRHAAGARTTVTVGYTRDAVTLEIEDEGCAHGPVGGTSTGHGLVGMRERVALYDGDFDAGVRPTGGFRVSARLPIAERA